MRRFTHHQLVSRLAQSTSRRDAVAVSAASCLMTACLLPQQRVHQNQFSSNSNTTTTIIRRPASAFNSTFSPSAAANAHQLFAASARLSLARRLQASSAPKKDLYEVIGVTRKASQDEIKKKYRAKAKTLHPDINPDPKAKDKFAELQQAYDVLGDPQKRNVYDMTGNAGAAGNNPFGAGGNPFAGMGGQNPFGQGGGANPFAGMGGNNPFAQGGGGGAPGAGGAGQGGYSYQDFQEIFEKMTGEGRGSGEKAKKPQGPEPGADVHFKLKLTFMEAVGGATKEISYNTVRKCVSCSGNGFKDAATKSQCPQCNGRGKKVMSTGFFHMQQDCQNCGGSGELGRSQCTQCTGKGCVKDRAVQNLPVPKGVNNKERLKIVGKGEAGTRNGPAGNLYVEISVDEHPVFHRDACDIHVVAPISLSLAVLGGPIKVPTLTGEVETKVPVGTQQGDKVVLRGRGVHRPTQQKQGDLYVHFVVMLPKVLSDTQREAIAQFAKDEQPIKLNDTQLQELKSRYKSWFTQA